ncbi:hypothetical protein [Marinifilum fragile]|uniref:hypothetical protein n=1 Tax=Marinifilum fragile TaxID=570161 RepID=UPI002AAC398F|nr:hypothetical protein [Marinifilum fragile]
MTNIKYAITDIFKRDFAYHLFDGKKWLRNLSIYLPAISSLILQIVVLVTGIKYNWNHNLILVITILISIVMITGIILVRFIRLKKMNIKAEELNSQILMRNYKSAIGDIFFGDVRDIEILDEIIPLYLPDVKKYNERFVHKATVVALVVVFFSYWFNLLFLDRIKDYLKGLNTNELVLVSFFIGLIGMLLIGGYRIGINIYYKKESKNSIIYDRLCTLRIKLIKEFKIEKPNGFVNN